jgi:transaldolase
MWLFKMKYLSPLHEAAVRFPQTELWNDSCGAAEVKFAMERRAVGATSNPVIVGRILKEEMQNWRGRIDSLLADEIPEASDEELCWKLTEEAGRASSQMFMPMFLETDGKRGWQALQVNPRYYRSTEKQ